MIQSVRLEDMLADRPSRWRGIPRSSKIVTPALSVLFLTVAAASAVYYVRSGPEESAVLTTDEPAPLHTGSITTNSGVSAERAPPSDANPFEPETVAAARLPRPRPEAPAYAVGAWRSGYDRRYAYADRPAAGSDPCATLRAMSAYIPFRVYCVSDPRAAPAHPRYRSRSPYARW